MARSRAIFTRSMCTFGLVLVSAFFFHERSHAFSPSPNPLCTRNYGVDDDSWRQAAASETDNEDTAINKEESTPTTTTTLPICYDPALIRFRSRISYDGTSFSGFQLQGGRGDTNTKDSKPKNGKHKKQNNNPRTIQGELERILSTRFQRVVKVVGAGRTDGGVHARGQAIHFDLYPNETISDDASSFEKDLECTMNRMLPSDIRAWRVGRTNPSAVLDTGSEHTPPGVYNWNAMRTSVSKLYSYRICVGDTMDPLERHHRWQLPWPGVDPVRLERVLQRFEGQNDFVCFAGALEQRQKKTGIAMGTVRTIHKIRLVRETKPNNGCNEMGGDPSEHYYRIDIYLDGALYKMVRNIVGTAIDACIDKIDEDLLSDLLYRPGELNYTRKDNPCMPAPPNGLTLERVFYPDDEDF